MIKDLIRKKNEIINQSYSNSKEIEKLVLKENIRVYSSFDIKCPEANLEEIQENLVYYTIENTLAPLFVSKRKDIRKIKHTLDVFFRFYQNEIGTINNIDSYCKDIEEVYLISSALLDEKLRVTDKFKYVGMIIMIGDQLDLVWLHPYFRNRGIMTYFATQLLEKGIVLTISTPISKFMLNFLNSFQNKIENDENLKEKFRRSVISKVIGILGKDDEFVPEILKFDFHLCKLLISAINELEKFKEKNKFTEEESKISLKTLIAVHGLINNIDDSHKEEIMKIWDEEDINDVQKMKNIFEKINVCQKKEDQ